MRDLKKSCCRMMVRKARASRMPTKCLQADRSRWGFTRQALGANSQRERPSMPAATGKWSKSGSQLRQTRLDSRSVFLAPLCASYAYRGPSPLARQVGFWTKNSSLITPPNLKIPFQLYTTAIVAINRPGPLPYIRYTT